MQDYLTLARPYAKAAFEFALENKTIDSWGYFLKVAQQIMRDPETVSFLKNPAVTQEHLLALLKDVIGKALDEQKENFLKLLMSHKRLAVLPAIFKIFCELKATHEKALEVDVFSVVPLSQTQLEQLGSKIESRLHRKVTLHQHEDTSLLGGFIARAGDFVIDGSMRNRLQRLTHVLTD